MKKYHRPKPRRWPTTSSRVKIRFTTVIHATSTYRQLRPFETLTADTSLKPQKSGRGFGILRFTTVHTYPDFVPLLRI